MQGLGAPVPARRLGFVMRGRPRVEVPAVVVEANLGVIDQRLDLAGPLALEKVKARDHIGHLHAGVVDVILYLDLVTQLAQHSDERVTQHRVAQVSDVCRLVGIDVGVLDDDLAGDRCKASPRGPPQVHPVSPTVETQVDVAPASDLCSSHAGNRRQLGHQFFRNLPRGLLELLRQRKSHRQRQLTERHLARLLDNDRQIQAVPLLDVSPYSITNLIGDN